MMVSTKGRYALRVMIDLAEHGSGDYIPLKDIADRQGISAKYLENIISSLVKVGFVSGLRGKGGGYRLTKPSEQYTAGDILRVTEKTLAPVACLNHGASPCERAAECKTLPMWQQLDAIVNQYLDSVTLWQLSQNGKDASDYVI